MSVRNSLFRCFLIPLSLMLAPPIGADEIWVPYDYETIQAALDASAPGDTVMVACGTYYEHDIELKGGVFLKGEGWPSTCVTIDAQGQGRVLHAAQSPLLYEIAGLTITGGDADQSIEFTGKGGGLCLRLDVRINVHECQFVDNAATSGGGAFLQNGSDVEMSNCDFLQNRALAAGAFDQGNGVSVFDDCRFTGNETTNGSTIQLSSDSQATLAVCTVSDNLGWGVKIGLPSSLHVSASQFMGNSSGGILAFEGAQIQVLDSYFLENTGPGIYFESGSGGLVEDCYFKDQRGVNGVGIVCDTSNPTIEYCIFIGNEGDQGALKCMVIQVGSPVIRHCTFWNNLGAESGGIWVELTTSPVIVENTIISGSLGGPGLYCSSDYTSEVELSCSNIFGNYGGDWVECIADQLGQNGNISRDPRFCDPGSEDLRLAANSPCMPDGFDCSEPMGAWGQGCGNIHRVFSVPGAVSTIQDALDMALPHDTVMVACGAHYEYDIVLKEQVSIVGESPGEGCAVIDAQGMGRIFFGESLYLGTLLRDLTLRNGDAGGSVSQPDKGGAVYLSDDSTLRVERCSFENNVASEGGAVHMEFDSELYCEHSRFSGNSSGVYSFNMGDCSFDFCEFVGHSGLPLKIEMQSTLACGTSEFRENEAGVIRLISSSAVIEDCRFMENIGVGVYGAEDAGAAIDGCEFAYHSGGAPVMVDGAGFNISNSLFHHNMGAIGGVASYANHPPVVISNCSFWGNEGTLAGGVYEEFTLVDPLMIQNCVIANTLSGPAISLSVSDPGEVELICSNLYGNAGGDWTDDIADQFGVDGNISLPPRFCDPDADDFHLAANSPCLPANNSCGVIIGVHDEGCVSRSVVIHVPGDAPSIQEGLDLVLPGDTVLVACGTYYEHDIQLASGVVLRSETGQADCVTIDAQGLGRVLKAEFTEAGTLVEGFTLRHGDAAASPDWTDAGGALLVVYNTHVEVLNCHVVDNQATEGGGFYVDGDQLLVSRTGFESNTAPYGSALFAFYAGILDLEECTFTQNEGHAVMIIDGQNVYMDRCEWIENEDFGMDCTANYFELNDSRFIGNNTTMAAYLGGMRVAQASGIITGCEFTGNMGSNIGGLYLDDSRVDVEDCVFSMNVGGNYGGLLSAPLRTGEIRGSTFWGNSGSLAGGLGCEALDEPLVIRNTLVAGSVLGPAVACSEQYPCTIELYCCDLYGNDGGDWTGCIADQLGTEGNIGENPALCDAAAGDFHVASDSPCLPSNNDCGVQIGVFGYGCFGSQPHIASIEDVIGDDGLQVRLNWDRSVYDELGSPYTITAYSIWRRIDDPSTPRENEVLPDPHRARLVYPPGDWDYLVQVPARGEDEYHFVAPTLRDCTEGDPLTTAFFVSAMTLDPLTYFDSAPDSACSTDDLPPDVPLEICVFHKASGNQLDWQASQSADFDHYRVYRNGYLVEEPIENHWEDPDISDWWSANYGVSAVDEVGNESETGCEDPGCATPAEEVPLPERLALLPNLPNPFNPSTLIRYALPEAARIDLVIFDLSGRRVATLLEGAEYGPGIHEHSWDGTDGLGRTQSSGVYFCRISAKGEFATRKLCLIK